ncbi:MAG TPA: DinB family protein [Mucilaginibacter sp.]|jgi:hypothetical protein|nr:DinB family protein [Mucilaginibacter sp.]
MNITRERFAIEAALDSYRSQLDLIPDDVFQTTPAAGGWSFAEVYSHILMATLGSTIGLEKCANGCPPTEDGLTFLGRLMMFTGSFPPIKTKLPAAVAAKMPVSKISKEEAKNLLIKCRKRVDDAVMLVKSAPPDSRYKHPRLGMLNAKQWFKFIRIHLEHHLKQLRRIKKSFS